MTDSHPHDLKQLEQATSRSLPPDSALDDDAAELRSGWLELGRALDGENASFREEDLLARLLTGVTREHEPPTPARPVQPERLWPALLASALALTMLMAVARTLWIGDPQQTAANPEQPGETTATATAAADWEDPLDDELDEAAERVRWLVAQGTGVDASLSNLADHLESMSDDLFNGSL
jgi:hypothetical protein